MSEPLLSMRKYARIQTLREEQLLRLVLYKTSNQLRHWQGLRRLRFLMRGAYKLAVRGKGILPEEKETLLNAAEMLGVELRGLIKNCYLLPAISVFFGAVARLHYLISSVDKTKERDNEQDGQGVHQGISQVEVDQINTIGHYINDDTPLKHTGQGHFSLNITHSESSDEILTLGKNSKTTDEVNDTLQQYILSASVNTYKKIPSLQICKKLETVYVQSKQAALSDGIANGVQPFSADSQNKEIGLANEGGLPAVKRRCIPPSFIAKLIETARISIHKAIQNYPKASLKPPRKANPEGSQDPNRDHSAPPEPLGIPSSLKKRPPVVLKPWPRSKLRALHAMRTIIKYF